MHTEHIIKMSHNTSAMRLRVPAPPLRPSRRNNNAPPAPFCVVCTFYTKDEHDHRSTFLQPLSPSLPVPRHFLSRRDHLSDWLCLKSGCAVPQHRPIGEGISFVYRWNGCLPSRAVVPLQREGDVWAATALSLLCHGFIVL